MANVVQFQNNNSFALTDKQTGANRDKKRHQTLLPHLRYVATLPCEM